MSAGGTRRAGCGRLTQHHSPTSGPTPVEFPAGAAVGQLGPSSLTLAGTGPHPRAVGPAASGGRWGVLGAAGLSRRPGLGRRASLAAVSWPLPQGVNVHSSRAAGSPGLGRTSRLGPLRASDSSLPDAPRVGHPQTSGPREDPGMAHIPLSSAPSHRGLRPESPWVLSSRARGQREGRPGPRAASVPHCRLGSERCRVGQGWAGCGCCRVAPRPPAGQVPTVASSVQGPPPCPVVP